MHRLVFLVLLLFAFLQPGMWLCHMRFRSGCWQISPGGVQFEKKTTKIILKIGQNVGQVELFLKKKLLKAFTMGCIQHKFTKNEQKGTVK